MTPNNTDIFSALVEQNERQFDDAGSNGDNKAD